VALLSLTRKILLLKRGLSLRLTNQDNIIDNGIQLQVLNALEESNVIYFIVSSRDGVIGLDREIAIHIKFDLN
jgi:predicted GTPase